MTNKDKSTNNITNLSAHLATTVAYHKAAHITALSTPSRLKRIKQGSYKKTNSVKELSGN